MTYALDAVNCSTKLTPDLHLEPHVDPRRSLSISPPRWQTVPACVSVDVGVGSPSTEWTLTVKSSVGQRASNSPTPEEIPTMPNRSLNLSLQCDPISAPSHAEVNLSAPHICCHVTLDKPPCRLPEEPNPKQRCCNAENIHIFSSNLEQNKKKPHLITTPTHDHKTRSQDPSMKPGHPRRTNRRLKQRLVKKSRPNGSVYN